MGWKFNPFTGKLDVFVGPPTGPAGGDLSGTYPNPTVDGLQGTPVSSATPYNGQVLQFDGTNWVPGSIPSGGSGGGGVVYFLNFNTAADAPVTNIPQTPNTSKELAIAVDTVATSYTSAHLPTASYAFLGSFVTDLNVPSATSIPAGLWDFNIYAESSTTNVANQVYFKIEVLKYDGVNAPTLISTSNDTYIYDPTEVTQYVSSCIIPSGVTLTATDRLVVYLYGRAHQANKDITFHFGSTYPSHTHSTMPSVTGTGVVKVVNGVFQSPATTIVNADVSASAAIDVSKLAMSTNRLLGRTTAGTGAVEEITVGTGLSLSAGTLSSTVTAGVTSVTGTSPIASSGGTTPAISIADAAADGTTKGAAAFNANDFNSASGVISLDYTNGQSASASNKGFLTSADWTTFNNKTGGSVGAVDNAVLRADVGTGIVQNSNIVIDDVATATQDNVAIVNASSATNSSLVLTPKGTGALIAGPKPNGTATGGNARGTNAVDLQTSRALATQVASGSTSAVLGGQKNLANGTNSLVCAGSTNQATSDGAAVCGGELNVAGSSWGYVGGGYDNATSGGGGGQAIGGGYYNRTSAGGAAVFAGQSNTANAVYSSTLGGFYSLSNRYGMQSHANGRFSADGDAQRARFVLRCLNSSTSFTNPTVDTGTDIITATGSAFSNGQPVMFTALVGGTGLSANTVYYVRDVSGATFKLASSPSGTAIDISTTITSGTLLTGTEMALDGATTYLSIPQNKVIALTANISGTRSTVSAGSSVAHYIRQYAVKNVSATSTQVYSPVTIGTDNAAGTQINLLVADSDETVRITVFGVAGETWRWVASVDAVEIGW